MFQSGTGIVGNKFHSLLAISGNIAVQESRAN
jgi:hypothetical protein